MPPTDKASFLREYTNALRDGHAALFVGAGISRAAGYVDWRQLLREIAEELDLDIERESDLVAVAQFHVNYSNGRGRINQLLIDEFLEDVKLTPSHHLIASLPVHTVWTTNYDDLIEVAFATADKRTDIKRRQADFATTRRAADVTIYKMHGDRTAPEEAVLTKEDFETYNDTRELFTVALKGDLAQKTFLFLGISFDDPNVMYILSRVKQLLEGNSRQHYCVLKAPAPDGTTEGDYRAKRFAHWLTDLKRYHIQPVLVENYAEVPEILETLSRRSHLRDVFISGSAADYEPLGKDKFNDLCVALGSELIRNGFNIISGVGAGVGDMVVVGAMQALKRNDDQRLKLRPFPQYVTGDRRAFWREYRERMLSDAGVCVVLAGNKNVDGRITPAAGVQEEIDLAREKGIAVIPIGATGSVAREYWERCNSASIDCFPRGSLTPQLAALGNANLTVVELVRAVIDILKQLDK